MKFVTYTTLTPVFHKHQRVSPRKRPASLDFGFLPKVGDPRACLHRAGGQRALLESTGEPPKTTIPPVPCFTRDSAYQLRRRGRAGATGARGVCRERGRIALSE